MVALLVLLSPYLLLDQPSFIRGSIWVIDGCLHHFFIPSQLVSVILLDLVPLVSPTMETQLASLSEPLLASIHTAHIRSLIGVYAFMLLPVLLQGKALLTVPALEPLLSSVCETVSRQRELGCEHDSTLIALVAAVATSAWH